MAMSRLQGLHLNAAAGRRFALMHEPTGAPKVLVVHVHAFAEEMNKARRMVAMQARELASGGAVVLVPDLLGCGDSDGEFGDATWAQWLDDVVTAVQWLRARHSDVASVWLWGLRAGCLLAVEAARRLPQPINMLFWQPSVGGKGVLQQFLRLRLAAELHASGGKGITEALRKALAEGESVEVAGYTLQPGLAHGIEAATLSPPTLPGRCVWLEVAPTPGSELLPASAQAVAHWQKAGWIVERAVVVGPAFWQTTEIDDAPALVAATTAALVSDGPRDHAVDSAGERIPTPAA